MAARRISSWRSAWRRLGGAAAHVGVSIAQRRRSAWRSGIGARRIENGSNRGGGWRLGASATRHHQRRRGIISLSSLSMRGGSSQHRALAGIWRNKALSGGGGGARQRRGESSNRRRHHREISSLGGIIGSRHRGSAGASLIARHRRGSSQSGIAAQLGARRIAQHHKLIVVNIGEIMSK